WKGAGRAHPTPSNIGGGRSSSSAGSNADYRSLLNGGRITPVRPPDLQQVLHWQTCNDETSRERREQERAHPQRAIRSAAPRGNPGRRATMKQELQLDRRG